MANAVNEAKAGQANTFMVRLTDTANRPQPKWGVRWNDLTVAYRACGGLVLTTKTITSGDWREFGCGLYSIYFSTAECATAGEYAFVITSRPTPYATFDDYPGNMMLPVNASEQFSTTDMSVIEGDTANILYFMGLLGTPQNATLSADLLKLIRGMFGRIRWDFTANPWTITVYAEDNTTVVASFTYANSDTGEDRQRT